MERVLIDLNSMLRHENDEEKKLYCPIASRSFMCPDLHR